MVDMGGKPFTFLTNPKVFRWTLVFTGMIKEGGWASIVYMAAIASINTEMYEAAFIDGANRWKQLIYITLPNLAPTLCIMLILDLGKIMEAGMDQIIVLYNNGVDETDGFTVNVKDVQGLLDQYMHTIHHEFSHIIDQKRNHPKEFNLISRDDYSAQWNTLSSKQAALLGFTRNYGSKSAGEDFAEIYSAILCWDEAKWEAKFAEAEEEGAAKMKKKIELIKQYTRESWGFDMDELRASIERRFKDGEELNWDNFDIE